MEKTKNGKWVHLACADVACETATTFKHHSKRRRGQNPPSCIQLEHHPASLSLNCSKSWRQEEPQSTLPCSQCQDESRFECRCRKRDSSTGEVNTRGTKKAKRESDVDHKSFSTVLISLFEEVIKLDQNRLFRKENANQLFILPGNLVFSTQVKFAASLPDGALTRTLTKDTKCKRKRKDDAVLSDLDQAKGIVEEEEPIFVDDFERYEDSLLTSLDYLYTYRVREHYYFSVSQLGSDLSKLISHKLTLTENPAAHRYINWFLSQALDIIANGKSDFGKEIRRDWSNQSAELNGPALKCYYYLGPDLLRPIVNLEDFEPVNGNTSLLTRLKTSRPSGCSGNLCNDFFNFGPFDFTRSVWNSGDICRYQCFECCTRCECIPENCRNRQLSRGDWKKLNVDVIEKLT